MTNATNFGDILDNEYTGYNPPKELPQGTYICVVDGLPTLDKIGKNQTEAAIFKLKVLAAKEDVDEDALKEALTDPETEEVVAISSKALRHTFFLTGPAISRLDKFFLDLGLEPEDGVSRRQKLGECAGRQVLAFVKHTPKNDGTGVYANVASTAPVE